MNFKYLKYFIIIVLLLTAPFTMGLSKLNGHLISIKAIQVYNGQNQKIAHSHNPLTCKKVYKLTSNSFNGPDVHLNAHIPTASRLEYHYILTTNKHQKIDLWLYNNTRYLKTRNFPVSIFPIPAASWKLRDSCYQQLHNPQQLLQE